jgi:peptidylprolyl isomerase
MRCLGIFVVLIAVAACQKAGGDQPENKVTTQGSGSGGMAKKDHALAIGSGSSTVNQRPKSEQLTPPLDLKTPPPDAVKTQSGLIYKKLVDNPAGVAAKRNDTVLINYTGWRQTTGETFFSNRSRGQPMPLNLASTAPGFTEAMQLLKKGEKGMLWVPPSIGYKGAPQGNPETLVYEVEVVDVLPAPKVPDDLQGPPASALATKSGTKYIAVRPGTGNEKARAFDTVTFNYTAWDSTGRMFDSTEMRKRPASVPPFRQSAVMEEILTSMTAGERVRFWIEADKMSAKGMQLPGMPTGQLCYEVEVLQIAKATSAPPAAPADVAKPPGDARKTAKGVSYRVLKSGKGGPKPQPTETVKVNYTGWTTDGRMFDTSMIRNEPAEFSLAGVIAGWTDAIPVMSVGDKMRFWIPEELAYKGAPGRPQGMLVFDIELLEIKAATGHAEAPPGGKPLPPTPPDVAKPPDGAKKTDKGVFYRVLRQGKGGPKPTPQNRVKVHYTGWTTDGKSFDSSVTKGQPAEFSLGGVIAGWTDGLQVMSVGDKTRFWIPEELAYKGQTGRPQGMLVFDIELLEIK